jgi:hypothetical protein
MREYIDLVIAGPDFSGTTTQISDLMNYCSGAGLIVKDLRDTEIDALFHADTFSELNKPYTSLKQFLDDANLSKLSGNSFGSRIVFTLKQTLSEFSNRDLSRGTKDKLLRQMYSLLSGHHQNSDLMVASMVRNNCSTYINPLSADMWVNEEPTRRGAGQVNRTIEQRRSAFGSQLDANSAALTHQVYRIDEFLRFRNPIRENGLISLRSRSEESACYQIYDAQSLHSGIRLDKYLDLPGHKIAFANPPTHIFVVCGPENWDSEEYKKLKAERTGSRLLDDHEANYSYQLLVNQRYASDWLEELYHKGCRMYDSREPTIVRFDIYDSKEQTKHKMIRELEQILIVRGR